MSSCAPPGVGMFWSSPPVRGAGRPGGAVEPIEVEQVQQAVLAALDAEADAPP